MQSRLSHFSKHLIIIVEIFSTLAVPLIVIPLVMGSVFWLMGEMVSELRNRLVNLNLAAAIVTRMLGNMSANSSRPARKISAPLLLAPMPPILFNAFGVSAYLAPLIGVSYWFSVQMVGIGQLIACYLIGLPILIVLHRRKSVF